MANDYLKMKWRALFKSIDVDNDGGVDMRDADIFIERFIKLHKLGGEKAVKVRQGVQEFWSRSFFLEQGREKIAEDEFVEITTGLYNADREKYRERVRRNMVIISDVYDVNEDGYLSREEMVITVKCHGLEDFEPEYVLAYPEAKPGMVDLEVFRTSWVEYLTNPDPVHNEIEKPCLISFNMLKRE